jgi:prepilin-type N-terminal cleavage/methylation domain-containing protein
MQAQCSHNRARQGAENARAFTLVELLVTILVLGALISIVFVGARAVMRNAKQTADRQTLLAMSTAIQLFKSEFRFLPPLVQDREVSGLSRTWGSQGVSAFPVQKDNASNFNRIVTYSFALADRGGGGNIERDYLRGYVGSGAMNPNDSSGYSPSGASTPGPNSDQRFSIYSLPTYLNAMGEAPLDPSKTAASDRTIDGFSGPSMTAPRDDGTFAAAGDSGTAAKRYDAFFDGGRKGLAMVAGVDKNNAQHGLFEFRDRNGKPIRYYRWLKGVNNTPSDRVNGLADLAKNVPSLLHAQHPRDFTGSIESGQLLTLGAVANKLISARADFDLQNNSGLKEAEFALVAAGPDGTFGDAGTEGGAEGLAASLGKGYGTDIDLLKYEARRDNVVEAGR